MVKLISLDKDTELNPSQKKTLQENYLKLIMLSLNLSVLNKEFQLAKTFEVKLEKLDLQNSVKPEFIFECSRFLYNSSLTLFQDSQYGIALSLILICIRYLECDGIKFKNSQAFKERYFHSYILLGKSYSLKFYPRLVLTIFFQ